MTDPETLAWLSRRCEHCRDVSSPKQSDFDNKLGIFTTDDGEHLVHMACWPEWRTFRDADLEQRMDGPCAVCGEPGSDDNPMASCPPDSLTGAVFHLKCFSACPIEGDSGGDQPAPSGTERNP